MGNNPDRLPALSAGQVEGDHLRTTLFRRGTVSLPRPIQIFSPPNRPFGGRFTCPPIGGHPGISGTGLRRYGSTQCAAAADSSSSNASAV